ncbi:GRB2-associated and regulator of MAPK [Paramuricea clavata]|uniref:GRB2-associated and regulator of MAPK n=1 Tax=Paramuricea clavata TaxID=317549 RepID=A0A6S7IZQ0_PARCT|nr:GRB2-associated and regulator of MAPK [Paramuricea clavata]
MKYYTLSIIYFHKAPPERLAKAGQKPDSKQNKTDKKTKNIKLKSPHSIVGWKQSSNKTPSNESLSRGHKYEKPIERPEENYDCIDHIYEETGFQNPDSEDNNYTKLDSTYTTVNPRLYEKYITEAPKVKETTSLPSIQSIPLPSPPQTTKPLLPIKPPPQTQEDKQAIYEAISRFPQDLSGLSVADVSRLLGHLNLSDYVQTFENELIDGTMLVSLDQESLESLGVKPFHCKKLTDFIGGWRPRT